uniref:Uncharacterized protein n=1 Tax=Anguilla anguilla TaxID=7936 RepID=A0A0E9R7H4_ANGAN
MQTPHRKALGFQLLHSCCETTALLTAPPYFPLPLYVLVYFRKTPSPLWFRFDMMKVKC